MVVARIPNNWKPRESQRPLWNYLEKGGTRAIEIAHRRWGKDDVALHRAAVAAMTRPATYWHALPEYEQGRRSLWTAVNPHTGRRRIDEAFPEIIRAGKDEQAMMIKFVNGSTWQVIGSDRYNSLVGAGVAGVTFSEWALCNPASWGYISPMLRENNGWAAFITTPRGKNHAHTMYNQFKNDPDWFAEISTVVDTGAFDADELVKIRQEYVALYGDAFGNAQFDQEYMCSFEAAILGSYYGSELAAARADSRICRIDYDDTLPVTTVWDIGYTDDTAILFVQVLAGEVRIIDSYHASGKDLAHYAGVIRGKPYEYARHWLPHDAQAKTLAAAGRSVYEQMTKDHGLDNVTILQNRNTEQQGIMAVRQLFPRLWIDERQDHFISAIGQFQRAWNDKTKTFTDTPVHDWTNHFADTLRYLAWVWKEPVKRKAPVPNPTLSIGSSSTMTMNDLIDLVGKRRHQYD